MYGTTATVTRIINAPTVDVRYYEIEIAMRPDAGLLLSSCGIEIIMYLPGGFSNDFAGGGEAGTTRSPLLYYCYIPLPPLPRHGSGRRPADKGPRSVNADNVSGGGVGGIVGGLIDRVRYGAVPGRRRLEHSPVARL